MASLESKNTKLKTELTITVEEKNETDTDTQIAKLPNSTSSYR